MRPGATLWPALLFWAAGACSVSTESDTLAPVIHDVTVTIDGGGAVTLRWSTNEPSTSFVDHGETDSYGTRLDASVTLESEHAVQLTGLALGGTYHFRITATDAMSNSSSTSDDSFVNAELDEAEVEGNLVAWCPLQLTFHGPLASETDDAPNPFLDYRLAVDMIGPSGQHYTVPGFFDGDGNGGGTGDCWRVRFSPDEAGVWAYVASFREGSDIGVDLAGMAGSPTSFDGASGSVTITPRDPAGEGFYRWGRLEYTGEHYLKFREGPYFLKMGTNSPENLLAYRGFDNTVDQGGASTPGLNNGLHEYGPHVADWGAGGLGDSNDPLFVSADTGYDSRGIIGALNYLASQEVNSIYFLAMNLGGDGQEVAPFVGYADTAFDKTHYDVSKLDQWNEVFEHAISKGLLLHFVLGETELGNRNWLDNGTLGVERKLYYKEMVARFGHALAIKWNLSEECVYPVSEIESFAQYLRLVDPYDHPIGFHAYSLPADGSNPDWSAFLGDFRFATNSIQGNVSFVGDHVEHWRENSALAGQKWVVEVDEITTGLTDTNFVELRQRGLYDVLFSGGGIEWYFGYHSLPLGGDLRVEDFRTRSGMWHDGRIARRFMEDHLPFWEMEPADQLVAGEAAHADGTFAEVFAKHDEVYAVFFPRGSATGTIDLSGASGSFQRRWFDPTTGIFQGPVDVISGGGVVANGPVPFNPVQDWILLIER